MRKILFIFLLTGVVFAQSNWGKQRLAFGSAFLNTDSLTLDPNYMTDSLFSDTLYTAALPLDASDGIYGVSAYFDTLSGVADSVYLQVRDITVSTPQTPYRSLLGLPIYTPRARQIRFGPWHGLMGPMHKDSLYTIGIAQSDSSWWGPFKNHIQYRLIENQADSVLHDINEFRTDKK